MRSDDDVADEVVVDANRFTQVSVSQWLSIGASQPPDASALYVSGNQRLDGTLTVQTLAFQVNTTPSSAALVVNGESAGQIGLTGDFRVQNSLGVGTAPSDDLSSMGQLVVRAGTGRTVPLQVWQSATGEPLTTVDANGQLGVGTDTPEASLTVRGAFLQPLSSLVSGLANIPKIDGSGFTAELQVGDWISIPGVPPTLFNVLSLTDTELQVSPAPKADFSQATAYRDPDPLVTVQDAHGDQQFAVGRRGDLTIGGSLSASGPAHLGGTLNVSGGTTMTGLTVSGAMSLTSTLSVTGSTTLAALSANGPTNLFDTLIVAKDTTLGAVTARGAAVLQDTLSVSNSATLGALTVSGAATLSGTLNVTGDTGLGRVTSTGQASLSSLAVGKTGQSQAVPDGMAWAPGPIILRDTLASVGPPAADTSLMLGRSIVRMGRLDKSQGTNGEVVGALGFLDYGVAHGQFSYRAGFWDVGIIKFAYGFEFVNRSADGPSLDYGFGSHPYANTYCGLSFTSQSLATTGHFTSLSENGALVLNSGPAASSNDSGIWFRSNQTLGDISTYTTMMRIRQDSSLNITLDVEGSITHRGSISKISDARLKHRVEPVVDALDRLAGVRGVTFEWLDGAGGHPDGRRDLGLLGQEVERAFPEAVSRWRDTDYVAVDYTKLTPVLIEAVKELRRHDEAMAEGLEGAIDVLTARYDALAQRVLDLEQDRAR